MEVTVEEIPRQSTRKRQATKTPPPGTSTEPARRRKTSEAGIIPTATSNQFEALQNLDDMDLPSPPKDEKKERSPPPIVLRDKSNWTDISRKISNARLSFTKAKNIKDGISINPVSINDYRGITRLFDSLQVEYHTYALPEEKPLKVVLRNLPFETLPEDILEDLRNQNLPAKTVSKMTNAQKKPMPLFLVTLERTVEAKKIFDIKFVNRLAVRVESPKSKPGASQCHKCQRFHHGQSRCHAAARCVKCGGLHHSIQCTKPRTEPAVCANCGGPYPANYKGCAAYPTMKSNVRQPRTTVTEKPRSSVEVQAKTTPSEKHSTSGLNYTQALKGKTAQKPSPAVPKTSPKPVERKGIPDPTNFGKMFEMFSTFNIEKFKAVLQKMCTVLTNATTLPEIMIGIFQCIPDICAIFSP
ncbi:hypothetical protein WA026_009152 [Henosepilachna vigintioctopunctata]|uniref:Pre-C2HC domain-containing protein n=1 Tax=Henosepilachna vigintioctopunctata TaxID=420089 RepID=A0AAW1UY64_9CUCU